MKFVFLLFVIGCSLAAKKALLIGINYKGTQSQLNGCANDVYNHKKALISTFGFAEHDIKVQTEDGNEKPTKANIEKGISWLTSGLQAGDVIVFHYSGHGSQIPDSTGREKDGKTEVLVPLDFDHNQYQTSFITDTYINEHLVRAIPKGVKCLALFDCCHSGSASNLYTMRSIDNSLNIKPRYLEPPEWMKEMFPKDEEPKIKVRAPPMGGDESGGPEEFEFGPEEFQEMMNDPEFAQMMANDPEFQQMMNDPEFQQMMSQYGQDGQDPYGGQYGQDQYGADQDPYGGQDPYGQYGGGQQQQQQQGGGHGNNDGAAAIHGADPDVDYWSFSGCRDDQTSADATLDGVPQGAFTWGYLSSLRDHNYDVTFEQLLNTIKGKLSKKTFPQVPVLATTSEARLQSKITL